MKRRRIFVRNKFGRSYWRSLPFGFNEDFSPNKFEEDYTDIIRNATYKEQIDENNENLYSRIESDVEHLDVNNEELSDEELSDEEQFNSSDEEEINDENLFEEINNGRFTSNNRLISIKK